MPSRSNYQGKPFRNSGFKRVDNVLNRVLVNLGLDKRLKEHTLMNLWPTLIGEPWSRKSRSLFIDSQANLVVAVSDASVGQELSLLKTTILKKLRLTGQTLGVDVKGLRFDLKHFNASADESLLLPDARALPEPKEKDLANIALGTAELEEIANLRKLLSESAPQQQEHGGIAADRIVSIFEQELRVRRWRKANDYPQCRGCQMPVLTLHGPDGLCAPCYFSGS